MIELPEAVVIARQITQTLGGKRIAHALANASPHKFAWYTGDPAEYNDRLAGKVIGTAAGVAGSVEVKAGDMLLAVSAPIRYHVEGEQRPKKHQLLLEFEDGTAISSSAQMWGGFFCWPAGEKGGFPDYDVAKTRPSPLTDAFDRAYFCTLFDTETPKLSAKAFLATEQRIPGLGNGVLQDILWTARIHPKQKMGELPDLEVDAMYDAVKRVLAAMTAQGGREHRARPLWPSRRLQDRLEQKHGGHALPRLRDRCPQGALHGRQHLLLRRMPEPVGRKRKSRMDEKRVRLFLLAQ